MSQARILSRSSSSAAGVDLPEPIRPDTYSMARDVLDLFRSLLVEVGSPLLPEMDELLSGRMSVGDVPEDRRFLALQGFGVS